MSENIKVAIITAVVSLLGGVIGKLIDLYAIRHAPKIKAKTKNNPASKSHLWNKTIVGAIIGAVITLLILLLWDMFPSQNTGSDPSSVVAISDSFNSPDGTYNTDVWECNNECDLNKLFIENEVLNLQRDQEGWLLLLSRSSFPYNKLVSLEGKMKISNSSNRSMGWLGFDYNSACDIDGTESPFIQCNYATSDSITEYETAKKPIKLGAWYKISIEFEQEPFVIRYFLDDILIGEYFPATYPESVKITLGMSSQNGITQGLVYMDDIKLILRK